MAGVGRLSGNACSLFRKRRRKSQHPPRVFVVFFERVNARFLTDVWRRCVAAGFVACAVVREKRAQTLLFLTVFPSPFRYFCSSSLLSASPFSASLLSVFLSPFSSVPVDWYGLSVCESSITSDAFPLSPFRSSFGAFVSLLAGFFRLPPSFLLPLASRLSAGCPLSSAPVSLCTVMAGIVFVCVYREKLPPLHV